MEPLNINLDKNLIEMLDYDQTFDYTRDGVVFRPASLTNKLKIGKVEFKEDFFSGGPMTQPLRFWPSMYRDQYPEGLDYFNEVEIFCPDPNLRLYNIGSISPSIGVPRTLTYTITNYNATNNTNYWGMNAVQFTINPIPIAPLTIETPITSNGEHTILTTQNLVGMSSVTFTVDVPSGTPNTTTLNEEYDSFKGEFPRWYSYNVAMPYNGYSQVKIKINPMQTESRSIRIEGNGLVTIAPLDPNKLIESILLDVAVDNKTKIRFITCSKTSVNDIVEYGIILNETEWNYVQENHTAFVYLQPGETLIKIIPDDERNMYILEGYTNSNISEGNYPVILRGNSYWIKLIDNKINGYLYLLDDNFNFVLGTNSELKSYSSSVSYIFAKILIFRDNFDIPELLTVN